MFGIFHVFNLLNIIVRAALFFKPTMWEARKIRRETQPLQVDYMQVEWYQYACIYTNMCFSCWIEAKSCSCTKTVE